jgi:hypothetical protein
MVAVAAIVMGSLAGSEMSHAPGSSAMEFTSNAAVQSGVPDKHDSIQCWRKKHNKHACIPLIGGGYVSSPPGQLITPTGGGYVSTPPGVAMPPVGGGYVSTPPGEAIPPSGGGYVSTPPGEAIPPSGGGYVSTPPGQAIPPSG